MDVKKTLTIGKLASASGVHVETVRFYERKGLLNQPQKDGGFRYYSDNYITRIIFIKRAQELGFTLKQTEELLDLRIKNHATCSDVLTKTQEKIFEINQKIKDLKQMKKSLEGLADCCEDTNVPLSDCPVLDCFMAKKRFVK